MTSSMKAMSKQAAPQWLRVSGLALVSSLWNKSWFLAPSSDARVTGGVAAREVVSTFFLLLITNSEVPVQHFWNAPVKDGREAWLSRISIMPEPSLNVSLVTRSAERSLIPSGRSLLAGQYNLVLGVTWCLIIILLPSTSH